MTATPSPDELSRRDFLRVGSLSMIGLSAGEGAKGGPPAPWPRRCIFLVLSGGPSQLETFDPKPHASLEVRGPWRPIPTSLPGVYFSETLPQLAQRADRLTVIRSLTHDAAPLHETGLQLLQTGRLAGKSFVPPSVGSIVSRLAGPFNGVPANVVLPKPLPANGSVWQGQGAGSLGAEFDPVAVTEAADSRLRFDWDAEPDEARDAYGDSPLGRACLHARRVSEQGVRFVTVRRLEGGMSWDCHGHPSAPTTLLDYRHTICAEFDRALSALLDDLEQTGMLAETLVVAAGEFGRTPRINAQGGRDHWPGVWSAVLAGAGLPAGLIYGASDARASAPVDRPVHPGQLVATILVTLRLDPQASLGENLWSACDHGPLDLT